MNRYMILFLMFTGSFGVQNGYTQEYKIPARKPGILKTLSLKSAKEFSVPLSFLAYGIIGIESDGLQGVNHHFRNKTQRPDIQFRMSIDNYLQFSPTLAVFALKAGGVEGKNNILQSSRIYLTSTLIMAGCVTILKRSIESLRPNGSAYNSFPSGHTATAFAAAELLHQEFKDSNGLISYSGYLAASATGALRISNDKHYLSEVIAGAGIGILSTKAAYWINKKIFETKKPKPQYY